MKGELPKDLFKHVHVQIATKKLVKGEREKVVKIYCKGKGGGGGGRGRLLVKSVDYIGVVVPRGRGREGERSPPILNTYCVGCCPPF